MKILGEWQNFRLVADESGEPDDYTVEIDVGIGPEGHYWIPATGLQLFEFVRELGEGMKKGPARRQPGL